MASTPVAERKIACNICRRRKTACDKVKPKCGLCVKSGFECEYAETSNQPGLRAGYVQHLEQRIDTLEERLSNVETKIRLGGQQEVQYATIQRLESISQPNLAPGQTCGENVTDYDDLPSVNLDDRAVGPRTPPLQSRQTFVAPPKTVAFHALHAFPYAVVSELCEIWFRKYHRFFPILHQPTFTQLLRADRYLVSSSGLVLQAIIATTLQHSEQFDEDVDQRRQWQEHLAATTVIDSYKQPSLQSIQALLVLSILQYGEGKTFQSWSFLAIARRMSAHIGLAQTISDDRTPEMSPTALRRLPTFTNITVEDEEKIRAFWMIETLDSISTVGVRYSIGTPLLARPPLLPCSDSFWAHPEPVMIDESIRPYNYCSAFSLCVILATSELSHVHDFLQKRVAMDRFEERDAWQIEAQRIDERLTAWRDEFVAAVFRLINAEYTRYERGEMDAYVVLTNCVLNTAVITLLQQRVATPEGIDQVGEPWAFASNRCVYASENTAFKVRQMAEDELSICHPHLIFSIFVAARFYIVHSKALDANVPTNLHSLAFALHVCGKRWPLARIFELVIRVAVAEYRTPVAQSRVPKEFYNLGLTTFEVSDLLVEWAEGTGSDISLSLDNNGDAVGNMDFTPMTVDVLA